MNENTCTNNLDIEHTKEVENYKNDQTIILNRGQIYFLDVTHGTKQYGTGHNSLIQKATYMMFPKCKHKRKLKILVNVL